MEDITPINFLRAVLDGKNWWNLLSAVFFGRHRRFRFYNKFLKFNSTKDNIFEHQESLYMTQSAFVLKFL